MTLVIVYSHLVTPFLKLAEQEVPSYQVSECQSQQFPHK